MLQTYVLCCFRVGWQSVASPDRFEHSSSIRLFLSGDVMPGRGIDQILPYPSSPRLYESYVVDARDYVALAEATHGSIPRGAGYDYIWGDALDVLQRLSPDLRIINLETAITTSDAYWMGKGINYRMNPGNVPCLSAAGIDCCVLANNHVLDWGYQGLTDTLDALHTVGIVTAGAGRTLDEAQRPAVFELEENGRVIIFSVGHPSSGIPQEWAASGLRSGVAFIDNLNEEAIRTIAAQVQCVRRTRDIVVVSIHWGGNWGYQIPKDHQQFAHQLIDGAGVDIVHGHSSHHPKGIEVYHDKPIIYGCGDLLNDYEGIQGYAVFRDDLALMYFLKISPVTGKLTSFELVPRQIRNFRLNRPSEDDTQWLVAMLNREGKRFGTRVEINDRDTLDLYW